MDGSVNINKFDISVAQDPIAIGLKSLPTGLALPKQLHEGDTGRWR